MQDSIENGDAHVFTFRVPQNNWGKLRVTLAWDDVAGSTSGPRYVPRLVNNLDLVVKSPSGVLHYPWKLDPLPQDTSAGNIPPSNGLDPIDSADVQPAYKGVNSVDNLEVVDVEPEGSLEAGIWKVIVKGTQVMADSTQDYSLVSDYKLKKLNHAVGWLAKRDSLCPEGLVEIRMHDEENDNGTQANVRYTGAGGSFSPYTGTDGIHLWEKGTSVLACREHVDTLSRIYNDYAVLQLSSDCPVNGVSFVRVTDNENTDNDNNNTGAIAPSWQTYMGSASLTDGRTAIYYCYVKGDSATTSAPPWRPRGHGALHNVNQAVAGGCDEMHRNVQDDENTSNQNRYIWSVEAQADSTRIKNNFFNGATNNTEYYWNACGSGP